MTDRQSIIYIDNDFQYQVTRTMLISRKKALMAAVYMGSFMATLDISIVTVALPHMQQALSIEMSGLQWIVDAYALCLSAFMLSAGAIGDRYGRKKSWMAGAVVFTLGSAVCGWAGALPGLLAGRAIQGLGAALLIPGALSILTQAFPDPGERARVIGGWSSFTALALIVGPILGGLLVDTIGWPSIFIINLPIGMLALALGAWGIPETSHPAHAALDPLGQGLSVFWLAAMTYGMIAANEHGWSSMQAVLSLAAGGLGLIAFLVVQARVPRPLLPLPLFRDAGFSVINFSSFVLGFSAYTTVFFLPVFFQQVQGWSPTATGWAMAPMFASQTVVASMFGRIARQAGLRRAMVAGYLVSGLALMGLATLGPHTAYGVVAAILVALGGGMGLAIPASGAAIMATVAPERSGMASSTTNAIRQTGVTMGIALLATLMTATAVRNLANALRGQGIAGAGDLAYQAVAHNSVAALQDGVDHAQAMLSQAYAGGFHAAMLFAAVMPLLAALVLVRVRFSQDNPAQACGKRRGP